MVMIGTKSKKDKEDNRMKRKYLAMLLAMTMGVTTLLAGCGSSSDSSDSSDDAATEEDAATEDESEDAEADSESTGEKTVITWFKSDGGSGGEQALIDSFNESHDDIEVEWVMAPKESDDVRKQMITALAAGSSEYDVLQLDVCWVADLAGAGYLESIDDRMMEAGLTSADFNPGAMQACTYSAKVYALPLFPDFAGIFFRSDIVSEEDAEKLVSGDYEFTDLMEMAEKYAGEGGTTYGLAVQASQYEGLICNVNEWTANFSNIEEGLRLFKEALDSDYTSDKQLSMVEADGIDLFTSGQVVMYRGWSSTYGNVTDETVVHTDQVGVGTMPASAGGTVGGWEMGINTYSENKDAAWEFVRYACADEGNIAFCSTAGNVPGYTPYLTDETMLASHPTLSMEGTQNSINNTISRPAVANYSELSDKLQVSIHSYLSGSQELDATVEEVQSLLDEYGFVSAK